MSASYLSTLDNRFNPFTDFYRWYSFDMEKGYSTCCLMARIAPSYSELLPDSYIEELQKDAFDRIVKLMPNIYWRVSEDLSAEQFNAIVEKNQKLYKTFANS